MIITEHDLRVMDEAVQALFRAHKSTQAIALGAVTLRLRQAAGTVVELREPLPENVVELHGFSRKVGA